MAPEGDPLLPGRLKDPMELSGLLPLDEHTRKAGFFFFLN